jgi:TonB family protein
MFLVLFVFLFWVNISAQDGLLKSFYSNGTVESEINFRDSVREGEAKFYFENGNIKEERNYTNGRVEGLVKLYTENGKLREVFVIENGRREGPTNLFDENGNYLTDLTFESGKLVVQPIFENYYASTYNNLETNEAKVDNIEPKTKLVKPKKTSDEFLLPPEIEEEKLEDDPAFFSSVEVMPEPVGGMEAIYNKLIYPSQARKNEVQGTVKIKAFIDEYGEVIEAEIVEGIGYGCDDVARNAIYYARFKPGLQKGKAVRTMVIIPVEFKSDMGKK